MSCGGGGGVWGAGVDQRYVTVGDECERSRVAKRYEWWGH